MSSDQPLGLISMITLAFEQIVIKLPNKLFKMYIYWHHMDLPRLNQILIKMTEYKEQHSFQYLQNMKGEKEMGIKNEHFWKEWKNKEWHNVTLFSECDS